MPVGRPPKPTRLKVIEGNPGQRPLNRNEPMPRDVTPDPPAWLGTVAAEKWAEVVPELERLGLVTLLDGAALAVYCEAWETFVGSTSAVHDHGPLVEGRDGNMVKNPAIQIARDAAATIKAYGSLFGFSPSDRSRLSMPEQSDAGDLAAIFSAPSAAN